MTQELLLTSDWPLERLMVYSPQITACLRRLREKFPEDGTMDSYAQDIMSGAIQLWLMLDDDNFKGIVLTTIKITDATGHRSLVIVGLAGDGALELMHHFNTIETWAKEQKVDTINPVGRIGWKKPLEKYGYEVDRVTYRKKIS